jgi:hypothetical protein
VIIKWTPGTQQFDFVPIFDKKCKYLRFDSKYAHIYFSYFLAKMDKFFSETRRKSNLLVTSIHGTRNYDFAVNYFEKLIGEVGTYVHNSDFHSKQWRK